MRVLERHCFDGRVLGDERILKRFFKHRHALDAIVSVTRCVEVDTAVILEALVILNEKTSYAVGSSTDSLAAQAYAVKSMLVSIGSTQRSMKTGLRLPPWMGSIMSKLSPLPKNEKSPSVQSLVPETPSEQPSSCKSEAKMHLKVFKDEASLVTPFDRASEKLLCIGITRTVVPATTSMTAIAVRNFVLKFDVEGMAFLHFIGPTSLSGRRMFLTFQLLPHVKPSHQCRMTQLY